MGFLGSGSIFLRRRVTCTSMLRSVPFEATSGQGLRVRSGRRGWRASKVSNCMLAIGQPDMTVRPRAAGLWPLRRRGPTFQSLTGGGGTWLRFRMARRRSQGELLWLKRLRQIIIRAEAQALQSGQRLGLVSVSSMTGVSLPSSRKRLQQAEAIFARHHDVEDTARSKLKVWNSLRAAAASAAVVTLNGLRASDTASAAIPDAVIVVDNQKVCFSGSQLAPLVHEPARR